MLYRAIDRAIDSTTDAVQHSDHRVHGSTCDAAATSSMTTDTIPAILNSSAKYGTRRTSEDFALKPYYDMIGIDVVRQSCEMLTQVTVSPSQAGKQANARAIMRETGRLVGIRIDPDCKNRRVDSMPKSVSISNSSATCPWDYFFQGSEVL